MVTSQLTNAVEQWEASAGRVLDLAKQAVLLEEAQLEDLEFRDVEAVPSEPPSSPEAIFEAEIERLIEDSDHVIAAAAADGGPSQAMAALIGTMTVSASVLTAAQPPDEALGSFGLESDGSVSVARQKLVLEELKRTLFGQPPPGAPLPGNLSEQLGKLQRAGAEELSAVVTDAVLWEAFKGALSTLQTVDPSGTVKDIVARVKGAINWLRRAALRLVAWTLNKFSDMIPDSFKETFDQKLQDLKDAMGKQASEVLANIVGALFGRLSTEEAWQRKASHGTPLDEQLKALEQVVARHVDRIGQASSFREGAIQVAGILRSAALLAVPWAVALAPYLSTVIVSLAVAVVGFVCYQLYDGFNNAEALVAAA